MSCVPGQKFGEPIYVLHGVSWRIFPGARRMSTSRDRVQGPASRAACRCRSLGALSAPQNTAAGPPGRWLLICVWVRAVVSVSCPLTSGVSTAYTAAPPMLSVWKGVPRRV